MLNWLWWFGLGLHGGYNVVSVEVTHPGEHLDRTEYVIQAGSSELNRFSITHVTSRHRGKRHGKEGAPLILLSPFLLPGQFYEVSETSQYADSAAGRLANANHDVWLVDQRRSGLEPGDCESGAHDCSVMLDWDFDTFARDALLATAFARVSNPRRKPVIGGFSAGANAALATVNLAPHAFSGLFLYEGTFYTEDPSLIAHNEPLCTSLQSRIGTGEAFDPGAAVLGAVTQLAAADPQGPSPIPGFPPGSTNQQSLLYVFSTPAPAGALSPAPNFVRMIADFQTEQFVYSNQERLSLVGPMFDNYGALPALRDLACGLAGVDDTHDDHLSRFRGDVLVYVEGTGFGQAMFETAAQFTRARSVTIEHNPELGEADAYFHHDWVNVFYEPLEGWLDR